jgi:hypothetical protein
MLDRTDRRIEARRRRDERYRKRLCDNRAVVQIELGCEIVDMLVRLQWINERYLGDKRAIADAIERLLTASAKL